jgi:hypothetical protein
MLLNRLGVIHKCSQIAPAQLNSVLTRSWSSWSDRFNDLDRRLPKLSQVRTKSWPLATIVCFFVFF